MKETLQEAARNYVENFAMSVKSAREIGFIDGAKWQQEKIKEQLKEMYLKGIENYDTTFKRK